MKHLIFLILATLLSCSSENKVTIGYQLMANPWKYLIASGEIDKIDGKKVEFRKFSSGAKVINAMASGNIDIAVAGSTPIAAGLSQGLPIKLIGMMEVIGDAEAFVVRKGINKISELKGKKIGVPFGSTTHFHLMIALEQAGIESRDLTVLNLSPPSIVASWKNKEIDGAFVWAPALEDIKKDGHVLLTSLKLAKTGNPTFDGIIVRDEFLSKNPRFTKSFLTKISELHSKYNQSPWKIESEQIAKVSNFVGSTPKVVFKSLQGYSFPNTSEQRGYQLGKILQKTSEFLKQQGKIEQVLKDYKEKVNLTFLED